MNKGQIYMRGNRERKKKRGTEKIVKGKRAKKKKK
jgi:hypothetical protein